LPELKGKPIANAGAKAAVAGLTASGLFDGQVPVFFDRLAELVKEADEARREDQACNQASTSPQSWLPETALDEM